MELKTEGAEGEELDCEGLEEEADGDEAAELTDDPPDSEELDVETLELDVEGELDEWLGEDELGADWLELGEGLGEPLGLGDGLPDGVVDGLPEGPEPPLGPCDAEGFELVLPWEVPLPDELPPIEDAEGL